MGRAQRRKESRGRKKEKLNPAEEYIRNNIYLPLNAIIMSSNAIPGEFLQKTLDLKRAVKGEIEKLKKVEGKETAIKSIDMDIDFYQFVLNLKKAVDARLSQEEMNIAGSIIDPIESRIKSEMYGSLPLKTENDGSE